MSGYSQAKKEREYRIQKEQFPDSAFALISQLENIQRIKYYFESDSTKTSYEAKFKKNGRRFSVEFDIEGTLEDVEAYISEKEMTAVARSSVHNFLEARFRRYRIIKIQRQYPYSADKNPLTIIQNALSEKTSNDTNFEILIAAREENKGFEDYEILFDHSGKFIQLRKSIPPAYGYILY